MQLKIITPLLELGIIILAKGPDGAYTFLRDSPASLFFMLIVAFLIGSLLDFVYFKFAQGEC